MNSSMLQLVCYTEEPGGERVVLWCEDCAEQDGAHAVLDTEARLGPGVH